MEKRTLILISSCAAFLGLGIAVGGIGPSLANLAANTGSSVSGAGGILSGLFFGALLAQFVAGRMYDRFGAKPVLITGLALLGTGTLLYTFSTSLTALLALGVLTGIGQGCIGTSVNVNIAALYPDKRTAMLNLLNVFFGVGAVVGPAISSLTLALWQTALPGLWVGAGVVLAQIPLLMAFMGSTARPKTDTPQESTDGLYRSPLLWLFALFVLSYVGIETAIGGFTSTYVVSTAVLSAETGALLTSGFWFMVTVGRLIATFASTRTTPERILWVSVCGVVAGGILLAIGVGNMMMTVAAVLLLGLSCGPVFPTAMALVTTRFTATPGRAGALILAFAGIGGSALPGLHGMLLEQVSPAASSLYEAVLCLIMLALLVAVGWMQTGKKTKVGSVL